MKKIICICLPLFILIKLNSQEVQPTTINYLQKSQKQKTAAWLLMGGGILSACLGSLRFQNPDGSYGNSRNTLFLVTGLAAISGSITLFIAAGRNKRKAVAISFSTDYVPEVQKACISTIMFPSLKLSINL